MTLHSKLNKWQSGSVSVRVLHNFVLLFVVSANFFVFCDWIRKKIIFTNETLSFFYMGFTKNSHFRRLSVFLLHLVFSLFRLLMRFYRRFDLLKHIFTHYLELLKSDINLLCFVCFNLMLGVSNCKYRVVYIYKRVFHNSS